MMYYCRKSSVILLPWNDDKVGSYLLTTLSMELSDSDRYVDGLCMHNSVIILDGLHS